MRCLVPETGGIYICKKHVGGIHYINQQTQSFEISDFFETFLEDHDCVTKLSRDPTVTK